MDLFSSLSKLAKPEEKQQPTGGDAAAVPGSTADRAQLIASAKVVAEAAQSAASRGTESVDKGKVAGAAADLLDAASKYANLEGKSAGKLVDKAEEYLHQYEAGSGATATPATTGPAQPAKEPETTAPAKAEGEGGVQQALKLAGGLFSQGPGQGTKEE